MQIQLLKSKIHRAAVTDANVNYEGSLTIDRELMDRVAMRPFERVLCGNLTNGERFETYCISAPEGSGEIALNGAAAHKGKVGDLLVILTFINLDPEEAAVWEPRLILVGKNNKSFENISNGKKTAS